MPAGVEQFYDSLAASYHLIFDDWDAAIARQAAVLDALITSRLDQEHVRLHDCACGIGTQAIGLAALGYDVSRLGPKLNRHCTGFPRGGQTRVDDPIRSLGHDQPPAVSLGSFRCARSL